MCSPFQVHSKWFAGLLITLLVGWNISTRSAAAVIPPEPSSSMESWGSTTLLRRRWSGTMPQIRAQHRTFTMSAAMRKGTRSKKCFWCMYGAHLQWRGTFEASFHEASLALFRRHSKKASMFIKRQPQTKLVHGEHFQMFSSQSVLLLNPRRLPSS